MKLALAFFLFFDIVTLKNGTRHEGKVIEEGDKVRLKTSHNIVVEFDKKDVEKIEKALWFEPPTGPPIAFADVAVDPARFLRFYPPDGWREGKAFGKAAVSVYRYSPDGSVLHRYDIFLNREPDGAEAAAQKFKNAYRKAAPGAAIEEGALTIAGRAAPLLTITIENGDNAADKALWLFLGGLDERVAMVNFTEDGSDFKRLIDGVREAAATVRVVPEKKLTDAERKKFDDAVRRGAEAIADDKPSEAVTALKEAVGIVDTFAPAWGMLARASAKKGDAAEARRAFEKALELDPTDYVLATQFAALLTDQGKADEAAKRLEPVVEAHPTFVAGILELGRALRKQGNTRDAGTSFDYLIQLQPGSADPHFWRGQVWEAEGKFEKARQEYIKALRREPNHAEAQAAYDRIKTKPDNN